MNEEITYRIRVLQSLADIPADVWDGLACNSKGDGTTIDNPFITHAFLSSLEDSGSATAQTGWLGQHLLLEDSNGTPLGAMPCYLKSHSQGEYVFDHGWADAFHRAGGEYYPKLQCSIPFTPATGPRLLTGNLPDENPQKSAIQAALLAGLRQLCGKLGASSAHITFLPEDEWRAAGKQGYLRRKDRQFHWLNDGYGSFDGFLETLASRKRKNIRKERLNAQSHVGIAFEILSGNDITETHWDAFFAFYMDTGSRKWGRPYLTREFFSLVGERMADRIVLIMVKRGENYIAGAINFLGDDCLYGRHWGCVENLPNLHFEVCYYQAIEYAIAHGLARVEAGAQGEHKLARGYVPVTTYSAHHISNPAFRDAVEDYLNNERRHVEMENEILQEHTPFRKGK